MDFIDTAILLLAAVMVWLLYRVTRETRDYAAPHTSFAYGSRDPKVWRRRDARSGREQTEPFEQRRGVQ